MPRQVLIFQAEEPSAKILGDYFRQRGDQVWETTNTNEGLAILEERHPNLVLVDLHLPGQEWLDTLSRLHTKAPSTDVIITNRQPDIRRELYCKDQGFDIFLRHPFTPEWIERALQKLETRAMITPLASEGTAALPRVRVPIRLKITFPFALLAILFAFAAAYLGSRFIVESIRDRFTNQLLDAGKLSADWMVQEENDILENLRVLAYIEGVAEAIQNRDSDKLRRIALPIAINYQVEAVEILDVEGVNLLSLHHRPGGALEDFEVSKGETTLAGVDFVRKVLQQDVDQRGDKYAGLVHAPWGNYFYIAGPIFDLDNNLVGTILVGKSLETIVNQMRQDTLAQVNLYEMNGTLVTSTLLFPQEIPSLTTDLVGEILTRQDENSPIRDLQIASVNYSEILGPWEARGGIDLGVIGVSLAQNFIIRPTLITRFQAFFLIAIVFVGVIFLGVQLARQLTTPLNRVVQASTQVAEGDLEVKVPTAGNDEVMVLSHAFNRMVSGLQEGFIYRDLLGRTVSPEVREALRHSFASGSLRLEGQSTVATVLMSDIRGFTSLSETTEPTMILAWLNNYFGALVPIVTAHEGVVDKFEGDAMLAFFGILPTPLSPEESAYQACKAAVDMIEVIKRINNQRRKAGDPPLVTGIGINTGGLTAGGLGTADRLNYTIIGDTVNTTQRIQDATRIFGESGIAIGEHTYQVLADKRVEFRFESMGEHTLRGKQEHIHLYRIWAAEEFHELREAADVVES